MTKVPEHNFKRKEIELTDKKTKLVNDLLNESNVNMSL